MTSATSIATNEDDSQMRKGFLPSQLISFSLPYNPIEEKTWTRKNGDNTLFISAGSASTPDGPESFIPWGKHARALLLYICTEAKRTGKPRVQLATSWRSLMKDLCLGWNRQRAAEVVKQLHALSDTTFTHAVSQRDEQGRLVTEKTSFVLGFKLKTVFDADRTGDLDPDAESYIELSHEFFRSVIAEHCVPINYQVWARLAETTRSPMALDVYLWLSHRLHGLKEPSYIKWEQLYAQFGSTAPLSVFKKKFRLALASVKEVYPEANVVERGAGKSKGFRGVELRMSKNAMDCRLPL